ncbi:thioredoxin-like protein [Xylariomycetidae sp. FL0641]|nr:thioredoxin-like protein [Xylariomycetidae sp. FL0641]
MGGKIDCYLDIASYYSYIAFLQIDQMRDALAQHGVEIDIHPVLLGAINAGSGNQPPWLLPAKAAYLTLDMARAARSVRLVNTQTPADLMSAARTQLPLRALHALKTRHPAAAYLAAFRALFGAFWVRGVGGGVNSPAGLRGVLLGVRGDGDGDRLFTPREVDEVVAAASQADAKHALRAKVEEALARGAFGAPWLWVSRTGEEGAEGEPFFGSDRWHFVFAYLGLPFRGVEVLPPPEGKAKL